MIIAADCHVHLYPTYDLERLFLGAASRLKRNVPNNDCIKLLVLTERQSEKLFTEIAKLQKVPTAPNLKVSPTSEQTSLKITLPDGDSIFVIAGRQINTAERIEVLSLGSDELVEDKLPIEDTIAAIKKTGTVPIINWAPGKWSFNRGNIILRMINSSGPGELALCDTTLRPCCVSRPALMSLAKSKGIPVIAGSDPFPFPGEERHVGSYGIRFERSDWDTERPSASFRTSILKGQSTFSFVGQRNSIFQVGSRLLRLKLKC